MHCRKVILYYVPFKSKDANKTTLCILRSLDECACILWLFYSFNIVWYMPNAGHLKMNKILFLHSRNLCSSEASNNIQIIKTQYYILTRNILRMDWLKKLEAGRPVRRLLR